MQVNGLRCCWHAARKEKKLRYSSSQGGRRESVRELKKESDAAAAAAAVVEQQQAGLPDNMKSVAARFGMFATERDGRWLWTMSEDARDTPAASE